MKRFIFISDLHIGLKGRLQSFDEETEKKFASSLEEWGKSPTHLVLLGDVFDLLQIQEEDTLDSLPVQKIVIHYTPKTEAEKIRKSLSLFSGVSDGLNSFLGGNENNRITYVYGNHDHAFLHKIVQEALLEYLQPSYRSRFDFALYLEDKDAGFYAEHGNQLDPNNRFLDPMSFEPECPGSVFVLFYWNKLKLKLGDIDALEPWYDIFDYLWNKTRQKYSFLYSTLTIPHTILEAAKLYADYRCRRDVVRPIKLEKEAILGEKTQQYPIPIVSGFLEQVICPMPGMDCLFSLDKETEAEYRRLFCTEERFRKWVQSLYEKIHSGKCLPQAYMNLLYEPKQTAGTILGLEHRIAGALTHTTWGKVREKLRTAQDPFLPGIKAWYKEGKNAVYPLKDYEQYPQPLIRKILSPSIHRHIVLGHTHFAIDGTKTEPLTMADGEKIYYHNTGAWKYFVTSDHNIIKRLTYLEVNLEKEPVYCMKEIC